MRLMQPGMVTSWSVEQKNIKFVAAQFKGGFKGFSQFRVKQIGQNSNMDFVLSICCLELYGVGYGKWSF